MKQLKLILFILITSYSNIGIAQDTISIYFDFGIDKIRDDQYKALDDIRSNYDLSDIKVAYFIGMADSVGSIESNIILSKKRAKNVKEYCEKFFPKKLPFRIIAKGERQHPDRQINRRVDIVILYHEREKEDSTEKLTPIIKNDSLKECYVIDCILIKNSTIKTITKRKIKYTSIETNNDLRKVENLKYATKVNGIFVHKRIKWRRKYTRIKKKRVVSYIALIPQKDYEKFKILRVHTTKDSVCRSCLYDAEGYENDVSTRQDTCRDIDNELMANIKIKTRFLNFKTVKVKANKSAVNLDYIYYDGFSNKILQWDSSKRRRKKNFYFSKMSRSLLRNNYITRYTFCCNINNSYNPIHYGNCGGAGGGCGGVIGSGGGGSGFHHLFEVGNYFHMNKHTQYLGFVLSSVPARKYNLYNGYQLFHKRKLNRQELRFKLGIDLDTSIYTGINFQHNLWAIPIGSLNPLPTWKSWNHEYERDALFYLGTDLQYRINKNYQNFDQNIHLGFALIDKVPYVKDRVFIQYGYAYDYLNKGKLYPTAKLGMYFGF